jgi:osmotically-inducible protein OsmY
MTESDQEENQDQVHTIPTPDDRTNQEIQAAVVSILANDPSVDASAIQVTLDNRNVTLRGLVKSPEQLRRAEILVNQVPGVLAVRNLLQVGEA